MGFFRTLGRGFRHAGGEIRHFGQGVAMGARGSDEHRPGSAATFGSYIGAIGRDADQRRRRATQLFDKAADNALAWTQPGNLLLGGAIVLGVLIYTR
jgi:hypothetical protein